ncbi:Gag-Pol polyprotein [Frankliniella fusca]|uniref:Gag-Pol polyprotein n=1 Tax=Frankliniella fusca TaxID=407009 RepID=A0AAE1HUL0_9NEOP|nr:Gag-Pol polyprotein [Frankliniella fusca]
MSSIIFRLFGIHSLHNFIDTKNEINCRLAVLKVFLPPQLIVLHCRSHCMRKELQNAKHQLTVWTPLRKVRVNYTGCCIGRDTVDIIPSIFQQYQSFEDNFLQHWSSDCSST